jgi:hypothetical protein
MLNATIKTVKTDRIIRIGFAGRIDRITSLNLSVSGMGFQIKRLKQTG